MSTVVVVILKTCQLSLRSSVNSHWIKTELASSSAYCLLIPEWHQRPFKRDPQDPSVLSNLPGQLGPISGLALRWKFCVFANSTANKTLELLSQS